MAGDGLNDSGGEAPEGEEIRAGFGMGGAEGLAFDFPGGDVFLAAEVEGVAIGFVEVDGEGELADVVQEGGGVGFLGEGGVLGDVFGTGARGVGDDLAMFPDLVGGEVFEFCFVELRKGFNAKNE